jgi:hypothetical protein
MTGLPSSRLTRAIRRDHPNPVTLETGEGRPRHINWDHVVLLEESPTP